jgi:hypothetical protein
VVERVAILAVGVFVHVQATFDQEGDGRKGGSALFAQRAEQVLHLHLGAILQRQLHDCAHLHIL